MKPGASPQCKPQNGFVPQPCGHKQKLLPTRTSASTKSNMCCWESSMTPSLHRPSRASRSACSQLAWSLTELRSAPVSWIRSYGSGVVSPPPRANGCQRPPDPRRYASQSSSSVNAGLRRTAQRQPRPRSVHHGSSLVSHTQLPGKRLKTVSCTCGRPPHLRESPGSCRSRRIHGAGRTPGLGR